MADISEAMDLVVGSNFEDWNKARNAARVVRPIYRSMVDELRGFESE